MPTIMFNGKKYNSLEEMPANERQAFEQLSNMFVDKNGNGIPDFLEGDMVKNILTAFSGSVTYNGETYNSLSDVPPEIREKVQRAMDKLAQKGILVPGSPMASQTEVTVGQEPMPSSKPMISRPYSPTIQEDSGSPMKWIIIGVGLALCLVLVGAGAFFVFSR